jgi:3-oxoacyl-[acyl-carrier-protein] synthase-1
VRPLAITAACIASSLGRGLDATLTALRSGTSGLQPCRFETVQLPTYVGEVQRLDGWHLEPALARFDCRNNRLARLALMQDGFEPAIEAAKARYGPPVSAYFLGPALRGSCRRSRHGAGATRMGVCLPTSPMRVRKAPSPLPTSSPHYWA